MNSEILYRPPDPSDWPFVRKTWTRGWRRKLYPLSRKRAEEAVEGTIKDTLESGATLVIAASAQDPSLIYGFVCYDDEKIYFLYCKELYRDPELGIGTDLLTIAGTDQIVLKTPYVRWLLKSK